MECVWLGLIWPCVVALGDSRHYDTGVYLEYIYALTFIILSYDSVYTHSLSHWWSCQ